MNNYIDDNDMTLEDLANEMARQAHEVETWEDYDVTRDIRIMRNIGKKKRALRMQAEKEVNRINAWLERKMKPLDEATESLEARAMAYYDYKLKDNPKAKIDTPYGAMRTRKGKTWTYDEDKIIQAYPQYVTQTPKVDKRAIKNDFKPVYVAGEWLPLNDNGELFEGATVTEGVKKYIEFEEADAE